MRLLTLGICLSLLFGSLLATCAVGQDKKPEEKSAAKEAAEPVREKLLDFDGKPLGGVVVCLCARNLDVYEGKFPQDEFKSREQLRQWKNGDGEWWFADTGADGGFSFPRPAGRFTLLVSTDAGYVIAPSEGLAAPATLRLEPWARLEGVVKLGDRPRGRGLSSTSSARSRGSRITGRGCNTP